MVRVVGVAELERREQEEAELNSARYVQVEPRIQSLAAHIRSQWQDAQEAKRPYERIMLDNKRQRRGEYSPQQFSAIQQMHGKDYTPVWLNITETKCRAGVSWISDVIFQPGIEPFDIHPTPLPDLPPEIKMQLEEELFQKMVSEFFQEAMMLGQLPDLQMIEREFQKMLPGLEKDVMARMVDMAREGADMEKKRILDQFVEGGWYKAVRTGLYDIVTMGNMIHKGPAVYKEYVRRRQFNGATGRFDPTLEQGTLVKHGRVNPLNVYPGPDNTNCDDGVLHELISLSRMDLSNLRGLDGYDTDAIEAVLEQHKSGGLREWTNIDQEKSDLEGRQSSSLHKSQKIDCIETWGTAPGSMLIEYGFEEEIDDPHREYAIATWLIDTHVIKAILNPDPLGKTPYSKAGFIEDPDSFWDRGVPQLIKAPQAMANSAGRAIVNNVAIASGPQVEINVDRKAPGTSSTIYPWKVWETNNQGIAEGPAVSFYMPRMVVDKLMSVYDWCSTIADEDSGIPRYAHGDTTVGGAGNTVGGLSMLMTQAARGIKNVIKNIDEGVIKASVEKQYYFNIDFVPEDAPLIIGDLKIVASGSASMIAKEQQMLRRKEILAESNNEIDNAIFQAGGRKQMWEEVLKAAEMDAEKIFSAAKNIDGMAAPPQGMLPPMGLPEGVPPPAGANLDAAGNPAGGADTALNQTPEGTNE